MTYVIVIIPFCFAGLSYLSNHDVWSGLLDLVLRKAHKCTLNVKFSLNLSGMDLALPSCWPLLRYNIASCENHLGSLAFKDLCPRPNWSENNVFVVKTIQNLVRVKTLSLEVVKHHCKLEKRKKKIRSLVIFYCPQSISGGGLYLNWIWLLWSVYDGLLWSVKNGLLWYIGHTSMCQFHTELSHFLAVAGYCRKWRCIN